MEDIFAKLALHSVQLIGKAAFGTASSIALRQVTSYIASQKAQSANVRTLQALQEKFETKIAIISPSIDLIEIIAARGNSALDGVVNMSTRLRKDIDRLTAKMADMSGGDEAAATGSSRRSSTVEEQNALEKDLREIVAKIEDIVPYLSLALTASGANVSAGLPRTVSPGRLMQASAALSDADSRHRASPGARHRVGNPYKLRLFTLFTSSARKKSVSDFTWMEEFVKCDGTVERQPFQQGRAYELVLTEDMNDGRYHEETQGRKIAKGEFVPGRTRVVDVQDIQRMYYSSTGNLLHIGESKSPVLVLKVVKGSVAAARRRESMVSDERLPATPDRREQQVPEWIALEVCQEEEEGDEEDDEGEVDGDEPDGSGSKSASGDSSVRPVGPSAADPGREAFSADGADYGLGSLSLLEYVLRLGALEVSEGCSHLEIVDEKINLFLKDAEVTNDGGVVADPASALAGGQQQQAAASGPGTGRERFYASQSGSPVVPRKLKFDQGTPTKPR